MQNNEALNCGITIPLSIAPLPLIDIRIYKGMIMQNVIRFEEPEYIWMSGKEGWFEIADSSGIHGAFLMCGDGCVSLYLKNGESVMTFAVMKNLWDDLTDELKDEKSECHKKLLRIQGYL